MLTHQTLPDEETTLQVMTSNLNYFNFLFLEIRKNVFSSILAWRTALNNTTQIWPNLPKIDPEFKSELI